MLTLLEVSYGATGFIVAVKMLVGLKSFLLILSFAENRHRELSSLIRFSPKQTEISRICSFDSVDMHVLMAEFLFLYLSPGKTKDSREDREMPSKMVISKCLFHV